jgi:hypothetical protein
MRRVRAALFGVSALAAFTVVAWSLLAAVAATPAAALMISCPASCDDVAENCVATAVCTFRTCVGLDVPVLAPDAEVANPGCGSTYQPQALASGMPAPSVGRCVQDLSASIFKCDVQHAICEFTCEVPAPRR